jgi:WS/DGAT/MGAT family acyltransferase
MVPGADFMTESDALSWYMEKDPALRATVVGIAWLDKAPPWRQLVGRVDRATRAAPEFRRRPLEPPLRLSTSRWATDPDFDLSWHLRRVVSPAPHSDETVLEMARIATLTGFDRSRPLWEFTLVEGLQGRRAALVMKLHHSLTDGIGGVQLAALLFDDHPAPTLGQALGPVPPPERLSRRVLAIESLRRDAGLFVTLARHAASHAPGAFGAFGRSPLRTAREVAETIASVRRTVRPLSSTLSPLVVDRGCRRRLHMLTIPLDDLKRASAAAGGTVNDGFLAAVTGGLRRYHENHGARMADLRITMPISIRKPGDPRGGNRITLMRFAVPAGIADPRARIRAIDARCRRARDERSLPLTNAIAGALNLLPPSVIGTMLKHVDFLASDVPGFPRPIYLCGAPVSGYFAFGPTIGAALNATLFSYHSQCCIGVTVDTEAFPDDDVLVDCLRKGFAEVIGSLVPLPFHPPLEVTSC